MLATPNWGQPVDDLTQPEYELEHEREGMRGREVGRPAADCGTFDPWSKVAISKNNTNKAATTTNRHTQTEGEMGGGVMR